MGAAVLGAHIFPQQRPAVIHANAPIAIVRRGRCDPRLLVILYRTQLVPAAPCSPRSRTLVYCQTGSVRSHIALSSSLSATVTHHGNLCRRVWYQVQHLGSPLLCACAGFTVAALEEYAWSTGWKRGDWRVQGVEQRRTDGNMGDAAAAGLLAAVVLDAAGARVQVHMPRHHHVNLMPQKQVLQNVLQAIRGPCELLV